jgi:uncharacterized membrane protein
MSGSSSQGMVTKPPQRLVSLDVVRGITVAFMILVRSYWKELATNGG